MTQRDILRIVNKYISGQFVSEMDLLISLVREIVDRSDFNITGARIWRVDPTESSYVIAYQHGALQSIPDDYTLAVAEYPVFKTLPERRTGTFHETDEVLRASGTSLYSVTGIGSIVKRHGIKLCEYAIGFSADVFADDFVHTINVIRNAVNVRMKEIHNEKEHEIIEKDLKQAWDIQRQLLPDHARTFHDYELFGISLPDRVVGGDYFDYLQAAQFEERLGVVISDAASKGLPAAIQALFVSGAIRMGVGFDTKISSLIARVNTLLCETFTYERFVSLCYIELTTSKNGLVMFANAGHCLPLHYRSRTKSFYELPPTGTVLGIMPDQRFGVENINMMHGDILCLYTDGIVEAQNSKSKQFGEQRLRSIIRKHAHRPARDIANICIEEVERFSVSSTYTDDKTIVVIKRLVS